jgi:hypothetical protein
VKAYCDTMNVTVLRDQADAIHRLVGTDPAQLDKWKCTLRAWLMRGYSRGNLAGMFDWFRDGIPKGGKRAAHRSNNGRSGEEAGQLSEESKAIATALAGDEPTGGGGGPGP